MPSTRSRPSRAASVLGRSAAAAVLLALAGYAAAQDAPALRGAFPASPPAGPLDRAERRDPLAARTAAPLSRDPLQAADAVPPPPYRPVSPGALPERRTDPVVEELLGARPSAPAGTRAGARDGAAQRRALSALPAQAAAPTRRPAGTATGRDAGAQTDPTRTGSTPRAAGASALPPPDDTPLPANALARPVDAVDLERNTAAAREAERVGAIEARSVTADASPFAPSGIRAGSFLLRPTLEQGAEWTSNAAATAAGSSDFLSSTTLRLGIASDWSRHSLSLDARGTYRRSLRGTGFSELNGAADATLVLDLGADIVSTTALGYERRPEAADLAAETLGRPLRQTFRASTGLARSAGRVDLSARAAADRNVYGDAVLAAGGTQSQGARNNTLYSLTLRGGYEVSPALRPFVEGEFGRRVHDAAVDAAGLARSATRYGARAGLAFDRGEKFAGEVAAGWLAERPDDPALQLVSGLSVDANVAWSPLRGTQVNLAASTEIEASALAGAAGALVYGVSLGATRELSTRLTGSALLSAELRRYAGTADRDTTLGASASLTWWMNRYAGITGRATHERLSSTIAGRGNNSTSLYLGLTLQR